MKIKKYIDSDNLVEELKGQEVIFISGCFDIIHVGHLYYFRESKKQASKNSKLLVVTHDDESIKLKKGNNRPINNLSDRLDMLSELEVVDYISVWNGWESIKELVEKLKPKYIAVTDGDYSHKGIKEFAEKIGSELIVTPKVDSSSTSRIVKKIGI